jgi:hypothetical protein
MWQFIISKIQFYPQFITNEFLHNNLVIFIIISIYGDKFSWGRFPEKSGWNENQKIIE